MPDVHLPGAPQTSTDDGLHREPSHLSKPTKMTCPDCHTTKVCSTGTASPDILAYRYKGELVYVPVAPDYTVSPILVQHVVFGG